MRNRTHTRDIFGLAKGQANRGCAGRAGVSSLDEHLGERVGGETAATVVAALRRCYFTAGY